MFQTTIRIDGMMCGMCEAHINDALRRALPAAKKVSASHTKGSATFLTEEPLTADEEALVKKAINDTGYTFLSLRCEEYRKKKLFGIF